MKSGLNLEYKLFLFLENEDTAVQWPPKRMLKQLPVQ